MKIVVNIRVCRAERWGGGWEVAFGAGADIPLEPVRIFSSWDECRAWLERASEEFASDQRCAQWPGFRVYAELPRGSRKPNGWDKNKTNREVYVDLAAMRLASV